jgi:hypothetical protein
MIGAPLSYGERFTGVMVEKFAGACGMVGSKFIDLNHTSKPMILVSAMLRKFPPDTSNDGRRTPESGH